MNFVPKFFRNDNLPHPHVRAHVPVFDTKPRTVFVTQDSQGKLIQKVETFALSPRGDCEISEMEARVCAPNIVKTAYDVIDQIDHDQVAYILERNRRLRRHGFA